MTFASFNSSGKTPCENEALMIALRVPESTVLTYFSAITAVSEVDLLLRDFTMSSISVDEQMRRNMELSTRLSRNLGVSEFTVWIVLFFNFCAISQK